MTYQAAIARYLKRNGHTSFPLKAVLFDMDGVLFNSMPYHAEAWHKAMQRHGLDLSREEAYLHEGRTGSDTIGIVYQRQYGKQPTAEEIKTIYADKCAEFTVYPEPEPVEGVNELLQMIKNDGLIRMVVTGSGQPALINRLTHSFPGIFQRELMITAFDVQQGKPNPEPYLKALRKAGLQPNEAIVVENAPMGVQAGASAGIFTVAVNTGPINGQLLTAAGADLLFESMQVFANEWDKIYKEARRAM
ncbi:MAG: HAD-IA family hydrolase [Prevotellaceae bacterium]|jgi:HAD superfamily hydrolase (TIGR01509 family)|nr:HAD-IA family hydrolase [Prevotellaceae bacterium]